MLSFIVPAHNEETLLGRTLDAIYAAASELGQPFEVVVADDASTDNTAEIARQHGARVVSVNFRQIAVTRNAGARASCGERLFFVDADTLVDARVLTAALRAMDNGAVGGGAPPRLEGPVPLYVRLFVLWLSVFMRIASLSGGAFMFCKRDAFEAVGGFNEQLFGAEDAALSAALRREGRFVILWKRVLTSGRRARTMSGLPMLWFFVGTAFFPSRMLKNRSRVEGMWYDSNRANDHRLGGSLAFRASNGAALVIVLVIVTSPVWLLPWPESLNSGPLGTIRYGIQVFMCHFGLVCFPCAVFLLKMLSQQKRWSERIKLGVLAAVCLWAGWSNAREVFWFWRDFFD
jgi:cellulose synthase/poly-beta-1,6-N-acetylglucosamine synthase-like glycosyltransferase